MKTPTELRIQKMNTRAFIDADFSIITLHTREKMVSGSEKGLLVDGPDRLPQRFRLIIQQPSPYAGARANNTEASTASFQYVLLGMPDAEMEIYDWWTLPTGQHVEITTMMPDNGYERKGLCSVFNRSK